MRVRSELLADAWLVASKDLRIERSSRVVASQVLPFGLIVLILFGFGISPDRRVVEADRTVLEQVAPGLFWLTVFLASLLALGRSFAIESADGSLEALRLTGLDPGGVFLGKSLAVAAELLVLEALLGAGALLLYGAPLGHPFLLMVVVVAATASIAAAGTLYSALASGSRVRDTLVPVLVLPALAPALLGATLATEAALFGPPSDGWPWAGLLGAFAVLYFGAGMLSFGLMLEET
ncbi:MAG: heme exporter protein CcmB [Actinomycetota bacterium]|nr:heme exporter protein CcmB [Actinomycetota bacterium]